MHHQEIKAARKGPFNRAVRAQSGTRCTMTSTGSGIVVDTIPLVPMGLVSTEGFDIISPRIGMISCGNNAAELSIYIYFRKSKGNVLVHGEVWPLFLISWRFDEASVESFVFRIGNGLRNETSMKF